MAVTSIFFRIFIFFSPLLLFFYLFFLVALFHFHFSSIMGRASKDKRDIYYRKAKEEGYRARSAYKLLQIHDAFPLFNHISNGVVDLCAAPGSWSQVLSKILRESQEEQNKKFIESWSARNGPAVAVPPLPLPPPIIAVDLQEMAPIEGVTLLQGDITSEATAKEIQRLLNDAGKQRQIALSQFVAGALELTQQDRVTVHSTQGSSYLADIVVCDGAPDVTGLHELDEYLQHHLLLAALHITSHLLREGGTFVTKVFRGPNTQFLLAKSEVFFDSVRLLKPMSSRNASMECFMLCEGFRMPQGYVPSFPSAVALTEEAPCSSTGVEGSDVESDQRRRCINDERIIKKVSGHEPQIESSAGTASAEGKGRHIYQFLACGDLSGFDADMSYGPPTYPTERSLPPVHPPLQAPYLGSH